MRDSRAEGLHVAVTGVFPGKTFTKMHARRFRDTPSVATNVTNVTEVANLTNVTIPVPDDPFVRSKSLSYVEVHYSDFAIVWS